MTKLKFIVSPFYSEESFQDKTTGFVFRKTESPYIVSLNDKRLQGIKEGLRKNFLIPYDRETLEFITKNDISPMQPKKEALVEVEAVAENTDVEEVVAIPVVEEVPTAVAVEEDVLAVANELLIEEDNTKKTRQRKKKATAK